MQENLKDSSNPNLNIENDEEALTRQIRNMNINDNEEEKSVRIDGQIDFGSNLSDDEDSFTRQMGNINIDDNEEEKSVRIDGLIDVGSNLSDDEDSPTLSSTTDQKSEYQVRKLLYRD